MIRAGKLLTNFAVAKSASAVLKRGNAIATPPRVRISFTEKVLHGVVMAIGMLAIPTYISVNIKHYRGN